MNNLTSGFSSLNDLNVVYSTDITFSNTINNINSTVFNYLSNVSSDIQAQINSITLNGSNIPSFSIGSVYNYPNSSSPTVSLSGTVSNPILNFGLVQGLIGNTPKISIGTITDVSNGNAPSVSISGTVDFPILNFTLEQGIQGPQGNSIEGPRGPKGNTGERGADGSSISSSDIVSLITSALDAIGLAAMETQILGLLSSMGTVQGEIYILEGDMTTAQASITSLQTDVATAETDIITLQNKTQNITANSTLTYVGPSIQLNNDGSSIFGSDMVVGGSFSIGNITGANDIRGNNNNFIGHTTNTFTCPDNNFTGNITNTGNINNTGNIVSSGNLTVSNSITIGNSGSINLIKGSSLDISGALHIWDNTTMYGNLTGQATKSVSGFNNISCNSFTTSGNIACNAIIPYTNNLYIGNMSNTLYIGTSGINTINIGNSLSTVNITGNINMDTGLWGNFLQSTAMNQLGGNYLS